MAQLLRVFAAVAEDPVWFLAPTSGVHIPQNSSSKNALSDL